MLVLFEGSGAFKGQKGCDAFSAFWTFQAVIVGTDLLAEIELECLHASVLTGSDSLSCEEDPNRKQFNVRKGR